MARIRRHPHLDPVRDDAGAAGHGRSVAARLADDRRRFAGDRRLVDRRDAFDDLAVAGMNSPACTMTTSPLRRLAAGTFSIRSPADQPVRDGLGPRLAQRVGLRLAAALGHRLGEVGEQHREPEPERHLSGEQRRSRSASQFLDEDDRREEAADLDDEHHRVLDLNRADRASGTNRRPPAGRCPDPRLRACVRASAMVVSSSPRDRGHYCRSGRLDRRRVRARRVPGSARAR